MFDVVLDSVPQNPGLVVEELHELTGLGKRALKKLVVPGGVLLSGTDRRTVEQQAEALRIVGADVRVRLGALEIEASDDEDEEEGVEDERPVEDDTDGGDEQLDEDELPRELGDETWLLARCDIAVEHSTPEELAAAAREHREWMLVNGVGDPMLAAARRLSSFDKLKEIARLCHAAVTIRDEGRQGREQVPSMDAPQGDTGTGKGRRKRAKGPRGPKKSKRSTSWVKRLGVNAVCYRAGFGPDDTRLLEMLVAGGYQRRDEELGAAPEYGFCPIDDPAESTSSWTALPTIGSDPEYIVWGLRKDEKKGCPTHRFRYNAEHVETQNARTAGKQHASSSAIKETLDGLVTNWYRTATPQTTVIPIVYHRPTFTFSVHTTKQDELDAAVGRIQATLGGITRLASPLNELPVKLARTSVRSDEGTGEGSADVPSDLLLWLVGRQLGGTGTIRLDEGVLEWFLDDAAELARATAPGEKRLRVKLSGSPAEGGSLAAALADGATLQSARLTLRLCEREWHVTVEDGQARAWKLPTLTKADGTPEGLDAAVDERLRLWEQGRHLVDTLVGVFRAERLDGSTWRQRVSALRAQLGIEMVKRWAFDPATGVGFLFAHMLPGEQTMLSSAMSAAKGKRGKKATENGAEARA